MPSYPAAVWSLVGVALLGLVLAYSSNDAQAHHDGASTVFATGSGAADSCGELLYYFDVEPKEQKYLRMGTTYHQMVQRRQAAPANNGERGNALEVPIIPEHPLTTTGRLMLPSPPQSSGSSLALVTAADAEAFRTSLESLHVRQLRRILREKQATCDGCLEKHHLVERILEVRGWLSKDDVSLLALTVLQDSAASRPLAHHLGLVASLHQDEAHALVQQQQLEAKIRTEYECSEPHRENRTVTCVPRAVVR